ncbi:MAG: tRNA (N(6)-L-threonylcarbamoyladenosine(37)-C(2))-methylthiotransferase MtaB [Lachnospiraceae bacterium]|nr:tRNA (N(6)-L-threonylcarbamoyladenosine(37)-C(2))-methylthiotransferase MtaB [Lachnospiraceae bacterium]
MPKAALHNLGCKVNQYETDAMAELLAGAGYEIVPFAPGADVYVINTCTVTGMADHKSRQMLRRARTFGPDSVVVAAGCYVDAAAPKLLEEHLADILIGNDRKGRLPELLKRHAAGERGTSLMAVTSADEAPAYEPLTVVRPSEHTRAFLKVQDGCNQFCTYCAIPLVRGRVRSRRLEDAVCEARKLVSGGVREIVLTGIHLDSYGQDLPEGENLGALVRALSEIPGLVRIRLGSLEPRCMTPEFVRILQSCAPLCPHFHLSLQSGCDTVLRRMNRKYTAAQFEEAVARLREAFPDCAITSDVICGFPGETDEDFEETRRFLARLRPYELHVFPYSARVGTRAAVMPDQVPMQIRRERANALIADADVWASEFRARRLGQVREVLFEEETEQGCSGFTPEYVRVAAPGGIPGQVMRVRIDALPAAGEILRGSLVSDNSR